MNKINQKRFAEVFTVSAVLAAFITAVAVGAMFIHQRDTFRFTRGMIGLAGKKLAVSGGNLIPEVVFRPGFPSVRRAVLFRNRQGAVVGGGVSISIEAQGSGMGLFVITDPHGRIQETASWPGVSGVRAEDLETYLKHLNEGSTGGLTAETDAKSLTFSVHTALAEASRFMRSREEADK